MKTPVVLAIVVIVIVAAGAGGYYALSGSKSSTTTQTTVSGANGIAIVADSLMVNANVGTGTWAISVQNTGSLSVSTLYAEISTNPQLLICSGSTAALGLAYRNCPAPVGNPLPPSAIVNGSSSGTGAQNAIAGSVYDVAVHVSFANGQTAWVNSTVTAKSG